MQLFGFWVILCNASPGTFDWGSWCGLDPYKNLCSGLRWVSHAENIYL